MAFTTTAQVIIDTAEAILQDSSNVRWAATEHLQAVNDGSKEICMHKPDAYVVSVEHVLVRGVIQEIPAAGHQLMSVLSNVSKTGDLLLTGVTGTL